MQMIRHIVLINWKDGASSQDIENWVNLCNQIPDECPMVYNWLSSYSVPSPPGGNPSSHAFCVQVDLRSREEWDQYARHPFSGMVVSEGMKIIDMDRVASANILVEADPTKKKSRILLNTDK